MLQLGGEPGGTADKARKDRFPLLSISDLLS